MQDQRIYAFGPYRLDAGSRLLERQGQPVPLTPKVLDTLLVLVENRGRLLTKEELMNAVWPDTHVEEGNLVSNISILRKTLGETDDGRPYIQTIPKRGYRFAAEAIESRDEETIVAIRERHRSHVVVEEEEIQAGIAPSKVFWLGGGVLLA
jgi:DNA-binding winged helix-turn-helix (wHTH) protein